MRVSSRKIMNPFGVAVGGSVGLRGQTQIKVLDETSSARVPALAHVPSSGETQALSGLDLSTWVMFLAQHGVPKQVLRKLNDTI